MVRLEIRGMRKQSDHTHIWYMRQRRIAPVENSIVDFDWRNIYVISISFDVRHLTFGSQQSHKSYSPIFRHIPQSFSNLCMHEQRRWYRRWFTAWIKTKVLSECYMSIYTIYQSACVPHFEMARPRRWTNDLVLEQQIRFWWKSHNPSNYSRPFCGTKQTNVAPWAGRR